MFAEVPKPGDRLAAQIQGIEAPKDTRKLQNEELQNCTLH